MTASEQRRSQRVCFTSKAIIRSSEDPPLEAAVDTRNISLHGVFLEPDILLPLATPCEVEIFLSGTTSSMSFLAEGVVQRHDPSGMAIAFTHLEPDSYLHVLNLVQLHAAEEK